MTTAVEKAKAKRKASGKAAKKPAADKKAAKEADAAKVKAAEEKAVAKIQTNLGTIAKEVNKRMESFAKKAKDANDQRTAAAIRLAEAKTMCIDAGIKFPEWCDENIDQSYETARKLAVAGASDNPQLAIEDMRLKNKEANKKARDEAKKAREKAKKEAKKEADKKKAAKAKAAAEAPQEPFDVLSPIRTAYENLDEEQRDEIFFWIAEDRGYDLAGEEEAPEEEVEFADEEAEGEEPAEDEEEY